MMSQACPAFRIGLFFLVNPVDPRIRMKPGLFLQIAVLLLIFCSITLSMPIALLAQHESEGHGEDHAVSSVSADHQHSHSRLPDGWEGSAAGIAYSERNHHIAGLFVVLMGLAELSHALRLSKLAWTKFLLPFAMTGAGLFLIVWSDHDAWPIGSLGFAQTFFGQDIEILQHKVYGLLALAVGTVELIRRLGWMDHAAWATPLPFMAIIGGLMLFGHSHGDHPSGHKIAIHHLIMGTIAMTAGSSKLLSGWIGETSNGIFSRWEVLWAVLILVIGAQLLIYSE
jgi:putative copper resistance protein D